jgi:hypothetical protein
MRQEQDKSNVQNRTHSKSGIRHLIGYDKRQRHQQCVHVFQILLWRITTAPGDRFEQRHLRLPR